MADFMSPEQRSAHMAKIHSKNTKPEILLRRMLHRDGLRYRLHDPRLPGKPDLVFAGQRKVVFVNGCFWHGHDCPVGIRLPKSNVDFWAAKRSTNRDRDARQRAELLELGWKYLDLWECEITPSDDLVRRVREYLQS